MAVVAALTDVNVTTRQTQRRRRAWGLRPVRRVFWKNNGTISDQTADADSRDDERNQQSYLRFDGCHVSIAIVVSPRLGATRPGMAAAGTTAGLAPRTVMYTL